MTETIDQPISQLNEHVAQLFRQGRYQAALPLAQQACELARGQAGNDALALGESLNHLANLHRELGNYTQAEQPYLEALKIKRAATAYMGDDVVDLPILTRCGFACAPHEAPEDVRRRAHYIASADAGHGAAREVCEFILEAQGKLGPVLRRFLR